MLKDAAVAVSAAADVVATVTSRELIDDLSPFLKFYSDGSFERVTDSPYVHPDMKDPTTGVSSKDITTIFPAMRIYMPEISKPTEKFPIIVYFHGGAFCVGSVFCGIDFPYMNAFSSDAKALIVAVEYRLVPEHRLPAAYEDSWACLEWVCSHAIEKTNIIKDEWISNHGDFSKIFIAGDSAGGNITHNVAMCLGSNSLPGNLKITGAIISQPYFWGSTEIKREFEQDPGNLGYRIWSLAHPNSSGGIDSPLINPIAAGAPSLSKLGCSKLLITMAGNDMFTPRAWAYAEKVKESGWEGTVETVEINAEKHCFHITDPDAKDSKILIKKMASFVNNHFN